MPQHVAEQHELNMLNMGILSVALGDSLWMLRPESHRAGRASLAYQDSFLESLGSVTKTCMSILP